MKKKSGKLSYGCLSFISFCVIIVAWCVATYGGFVNEIFMPSPTDVWNSLVEMAKDGSLLEHCYISTKRVMVGWVWSAVAALPIGMLMARSKKFSAIVQPVIEFVRYLPVVALVPLTLLYLGIEENQKYVIIFLGTFFQLVLMVCDTVSSIDKNMINAARTLGAGKLQVYTQVIFPAALPGLMDDFRLTIGWAWTYLVVAEMVATAAPASLSSVIIRRRQHEIRNCN